MRNKTIFLDDETIATILDNSETLRSYGDLQHSERILRLEGILGTFLACVGENASKFSVTPQWVDDHLKFMNRPLRERITALEETVDEFENAQLEKNEVYELPLYGETLFKTSDGQTLELINHFYVGGALHVVFGQTS